MIIELGVNVNPEYRTSQVFKGLTLVGWLNSDQAGPWIPEKCLLIKKHSQVLHHATPMIHPSKHHVSPNEFMTYLSKQVFSVLFSNHHSNTRPIDNRTQIYHLNTILVRYSDGYCIWFLKFLESDFRSFCSHGIQHLVLDEKVERKKELSQRTHPVTGIHG